MAMQPISPRDHRWPKQLMRRLDDAAGQLNPFLLAIAIGLLVVYATGLVGLLLKLPVTHMDVCAAASASSTTPEAQLR
jgi:hypothetical protein